MMPVPVAPRRGRNASGDAYNGAPLEVAATAVNPIPVRSVTRQPLPPAFDPFGGSRGRPLPPAQPPNFGLAGATSLTMPNDRTATASGGNPLASLRDTATVHYPPAMTVQDGALYQTVGGHVPEIDPSTTRSAAFMRRKVVPVQKMQFGAATTGPKSDTSFHPAKPSPKPAIRQVSTTTGERIRTTYPSFPSHNRIVGDPNQSVHAENAGRWHHVKRGAAG